VAVAARWWRPRGAVGPPGGSTSPDRRRRGRWNRPPGARQAGTRRYTITAAAAAAAAGHYWLSVRVSANRPILALGGGVQRRRSPVTWILLLQQLGERPPHPASCDYDGILVHGHGAAR